MEDKPLISVVMCVYNNEEFISDAIESVLAQTLSNIELIIVNDGSTDRTEKIIKSFQDNRIRYFRQANKGASAARNFALNASKGKYIAIIDSDDICFKNRLEIQYEFLKSNPDYILVGSNALYVDSEGNEICITKLNEDWNTIEKMKYENPFIHSSVLFVREAAFKAGLYPIEIKIGEDLLFFSRLKKYGKMANLSDILVKYRINPSGASLRDGRIKAVLKKIIDEYSEKGTISKIYIEEVNIKVVSTGRILKMHYYHLNIAKLLLFNTKNNFKVAKHLILAAFYIPISKKLVELFAVLMIPNKYRKKIYFGIKSQMEMLSGL